MAQRAPGIEHARQAEEGEAALSPWRAYPIMGQSSNFCLCRISGIAQVPPVYSLQARAAPPGRTSGCGP